jgi:hypothetical protein
MAKETKEETFEEKKERFEKEISEGKRLRDDTYFEELGLPHPDA